MYTLYISTTLHCLHKVRLQEEESEERKLLPHKHDIISVLGVGGHWVTSHKDLQVSQSNTKTQFIKVENIFCWPVCFEGFNKALYTFFLYFHSWIPQILDYCSYDLPQLASSIMKCGQLHRHSREDISVS